MVCVEPGAVPDMSTSEFAFIRRLRWVDASDPIVNAGASDGPVLRTGATDPIGISIASPFCGKVGLM